MEMDLDRALRETVRWHILSCLNQARPIGATESLILSVLQALHERLTRHQLRRELDYLRARDLIEVDGEASPQWHVRLTRAGIDVAEYTVECERGIARPAQYWAG